MCACVHCTTSLDISKTITYAKCRRKKFVVSVSMRSESYRVLKKWVSCSCLTKMLPPAYYQMCVWCYNVSDLFVNFKCSWGNWHTVRKYKVFTLSCTLLAKSYSFVRSAVLNVFNKVVIVEYFIQQSLYHMLI